MSLETAWQITAGALVAIGTFLGGYSAWRARKNKHAGLPGVEEELKLALAPDWDSLTSYYKQELESLRGDLRTELDGVRRQVIHLMRLRELDALYIDSLEAHIWQGKPPPPPARPQYPGEPEPKEQA